MSDKEWKIICRFMLYVLIHSFNLSRNNSSLAADIAAEIEK